MNEIDRAIYESLVGVFYLDVEKGKLNSKMLRQHPYKRQLEDLYQKYFNAKPHLCCTHKWHAYMQKLKTKL